MKLNRIIVVMENKSGGCYQIALSEKEKSYVIDLIKQMHDGTIKITKPKLPFTLCEPGCLRQAEGIRRPTHHPGEHQ